MAERGRHEDENQDQRGEREDSQSREGEQGKREREALRARLERLTEALDAQESGPQQPQNGSGGAAPGSMGSALSLAFRVLSEFVSAIIVGAAIGWGIDWLFGTLPVFLIIFMLFGAAAGFWNVYRVATEKPGRGGR